MKQQVEGHRNFGGANSQPLLLNQLVKYDLGRARAHQDSFYERKSWTTLKNSPTLFREIPYICGEWSRNFILKRRIKKWKPFADSNFLKDWTGRS